MFACLHRTLTGKNEGSVKPIMVPSLNLKDDSPVQQRFPEYPIQNHTATDNFSSSEMCLQIIFLICAIRSFLFACFISRSLLPSRATLGSQFFFIRSR